MRRHTPDTLAGLPEEKGSRAPEDPPVRWECKRETEPIVNSISLLWWEKAGLCTGRPQRLGAAHGSGRDEMLSAALAGYPGTRAGAVGRRSCLPRQACSRPQSARRLLREPLKRKTTCRNGGRWGGGGAGFLNPAELANVGAVC